jgi:hypothetical protein
MSYKSTLDAITDYVDTNITQETRYPNDPRANPDTFPWVEVGVDWGVSNQITLGIGQYRTIAVLRMVVHGELGVGAGQVTILADTIRDLFKTISIGSNIRFQTPRVEPVGRVDGEYMATVICPFHWTET